ncbi:ComR-activating pheromone ComS [Streptococcus salivarius]|nr:ComR-activating pheromone ComS [Streptococcus salivarius]
MKKLKLFTLFSLLITILPYFAGCL